MKQFFAFALSIVLLLLCCGCTGEPEPTEPTEAVPCTEVPQTQHIHTFGDWVPAETQMQRLCTACGETELRDMTDEEQFKQLLNGHWQPYEVTMMGVTRLVYYLRTGVWHVYADYDGGDSLTYVSSLSERGIDQFTKKLEIHYSHFDAQTGIHHATATSADGHSAQIQLETGHGEPLLYLTPDPETDLFDRVVFSRYAQVAPVAVGTWSGIVDGKVLSVTLNEDLTFTSNIETYPSGTWQLAPGDGFWVGSVQLFYKDKSGQSVFDLGYFSNTPSYVPDIEEELPDWEMILYPPRGNDMWQLRKVQPELLQPLLDKGGDHIIGIWDSKSTRSLSGADTTTHIQTGYSLTVKEDGTFTMMADKKITGTWTANGTTTVKGHSRYQYLFTYPGCGKNGDGVAIIPESGTLSFPFKQGNRYTYLHFAQYSEDQWEDYLAGPDLLTGSYASRKIVRYDKETGAATEMPETGYRLTIREDGTVEGTLHKDVSGTWFYDDILFGEGHRYIFRMDHTPPEQSSMRNNDGTLVFDTKIDGEHVVIYFYPE